MTQFMFIARFLISLLRMSALLKPLPLHTRLAAFLINTGRARFLKKVECSLLSMVSTKSRPHRPSVTDNANLTLGDCVVFAEGGWVVPGVARH